VIIGAARGAANERLPILIVTGLRQEARIAAGPGMTVICSSSDPQQLRDLLRVFDPSGIRGIVSFGVAGGLDPSLDSGDVIIATEVVAGNNRWQAAPRLRENLAATPGLRKRVVEGILAGSEHIVVSAQSKADLRQTTGASAVDMESHIAADYAAKAGLPFAALRVISDPATRALPPLAMAAIRPNGGIDLRKVLGGIARNPLTILDLVSTGIDFNRALRSLRGCRGFLLGSEGLVAADV
jgi:adenosylhomocysteine nucleosidase